MSIKVLIACNRNSYPNPYVPTLADGLTAEGCNVTCSLMEFWNNATAYEIVHIQWPNLLVPQMGQNGEILNKVLKQLKNKRIPIVVTLHNLSPHYTQKKDLILAYEIVYNNADCFIHMGETSIDLLKEKWPNIKAEHCVIPHHTYDTLYNFDGNKIESRKNLKIPKSKKCILCFGKFRNDEERNLIINLRKALDSSYYFLVPGFYYNDQRILQKNIIQGFKMLLKTLKYSIIAKKYHLHITHKFISDDDLPDYMNAADVLIVQRVKILNSGNVTLAMCAGLPVIGPNVGNVGWMLQRSGNPCFDVNHLDALPEIVKNVIAQKELGLSNKSFAKKNFSTKIIASKTKNVYEKMYKNR